MSLRVRRLIMVALWASAVAAVELASFAALLQKLESLQASDADSRANTTEIITNRYINQKQCKTSADCPDNQICQKVCFWLNPEELWIGCKIGCVETTEAVLSELMRRKEVGVLEPLMSPQAVNLSSGTTDSPTANATPNPDSGTSSKSEDKGPGPVRLPDQSPGVSDFAEIKSGVILDGCVLNYDCADQITQFCSRDTKRCKCRPEYITAQEHPLLCVSAPQRPSEPTTSYGTIGTTFPANPLTAPPRSARLQSRTTAALLPPADSAVDEAEKSEHLSHMFADDKTIYDSEVSPEAAVGFPPVSSSAPSQTKRFDPSALWRALLLVSGSTSAPDILVEPGDGQLASRCSTTADCQPGLQCCMKTFCDAHNACGTANFCLEQCSP